MARTKRFPNSLERLPITFLLVTKLPPWPTLAALDPGLEAFDGPQRIAVDSHLIFQPIWIILPIGCKHFKQSLCFQVQKNAGYAD